MDQLEILRKVQSGELSVAEGSRLLESLDSGEPVAAEPVEEESPVLERSEPAPRAENVEVMGVDQEDFKRWARWRWVPFGISTALTVAAAYWIYSGWASRGFGWGFWLSWIPFIIGVLGMALTYRTRWLHLRIQQRPGEKPERIAISLPLPLGLVSWATHTFRNYMPKEVRNADFNEIFTGLHQGVSPEEPLYIKVDEGDGEIVEIYIG